LKLAPNTVRNHVATLYSKLDVHSRSEAIVWARERGLFGNEWRMKAL
jgi:DNA-binding CsgD family transcriptional regulator